METGCSREFVPQAAPCGQSAASLLVLSAPILRRLVKWSGTEEKQSASFSVFCRSNKIAIAEDKNFPRMGLGAVACTRRGSIFQVG